MDPKAKLTPNPTTPTSSTVTSPLRTAPSKFSPKKILPILIILIVVGAGIASGLVMSSRNKSKAMGAMSQNGQDVPKEVQQSFNQTFKDEAEGTVQRNDQLDKYAQGTHKLLRQGGDSQTAYLTSSVLDLDQYVGKKVKVFGETFGSSQVGWLMDVGKVEVQ
ncbi:MAG TPA: hypothetical protein VLE91_01530 [Candidatus Saccharimonadales bacterium]|nr:hypothetical protein [Candidatus Saccharimonadales bacterium]